MPGPLAGQTAVVTGGGRGIGAELAAWLAEAGAKLVLIARSRTELDDVAAELRDRHGTTVLVHPADVRDAHAVERAVQLARATFGRIDIAIANAAVLGPVGTITEMDPERFLHVLEVNVAGVAHLARAVVPAMAEQGRGRILTLSGAGIGGPSLPARVSAYVASKAAVVALTEALALELPAGVTVNAIAPGPVPTSFMQEVLSVGPDTAGDGLFATVQGQVMPDLEPLHRLVLFLLSDEARWLTGRCLSARWESPGTLQALAGTLEGSSRFRLRRIDEDLFAERVVIAP